MKKITLLTLLSISLFFAKAQTNQTVLYDAQFLRDKCFDAGTFTIDSNFIAILSKYSLGKENGETDNNYRARLKEKNPFLKKYISDGSASSTNTDRITASDFSLASLGGMKIPNSILLGVTDFIVKRTKQELNIAFFERFQKVLKDKKYVDLQTVFPRTQKKLLEIGDEIYQYPLFLETLQQAFKSDVQVLEKNLPSIVKNHPEFWSKHKEWKAAFESSLYIANSLNSKTHPGEIINNFPLSSLDSLNPNWKSSIQTLRIISNSLRDVNATANNTYWASTEDIKKLLADEPGIRIYLGLIYRQIELEASPVVFGKDENAKKLTDFLKQLADAANKDEFNLYADFIKETGERANRINDLIKEGIPAGNDSAAFEKYYEYCASTFDFIEQIIKITDLPHIKNSVPDLEKILKPYFSIAHSTADLGLHLRSKKYNSAIVDAVNIYKLVKSNQASADLNGLNGKLSRKESKGIVRTGDNLSKYGGFMAAVSTAKTSEEVENAIESVAIPIGGSRIKRQSRSNVALNAYCGLFTGHEKIDKLETDKKDKTFNAFGLTAPIGISMSLGQKGIFLTSRRGKFKNLWSHSVFISLVDLGAVAAYRFKTDTTVAQVPEVQLKDIFSPGFFYSIGIPRSPISLNLGAQVGPNLRHVNSDANDYSENMYMRYSISICVDIPLLNLHTRSE